MAGRLPGASVIVPRGKILTNDQVMNEKWNLMSLLLEVANNNTCLQWLARRRLLKNTMQC